MKPNPTELDPQLIIHSEEKEQFNIINNYRFLVGTVLKVGLAFPQRGQQQRSVKPQTKARRVTISVAM